MSATGSSVVRRLAAVVLTALTAWVWAAEPDVAGSRDPYGLERYPGSWVVAYERDPNVASRQMVTSRVDRIRRDLQVDNQVQVDATLEAVIYQAPDGVSVAELEASYLEQLGGEVLFHCDGRGCGRSADWANQIFDQSILYGPDQNQRYTALEWRGRLVSLYVIERGNRRVYAHLRFLEPEAPRPAGDPHVLLAQRLAERGWAVVEGVTPAADGSLGTTAQASLTELGARLDGFAGERVYLICHLYGAVGTDALLEASQRCAEAAAGVMAEGVEGADAGAGPELAAFGAGPLLPRSDPPVSRLELVLPAGRADR